MGLKAKSWHFGPNNAGGPSKRAGRLRFSLDLQFFAQFPKGKAQIKHIMADRRGHLPDTPANRKIITELVEDKNNFIGIGLFGKEAYLITRNGWQYWAYVKDGIIQDAGANAPGDHRTNFEILFGRKKK